MATRIPGLLLFIIAVACSEDIIKPVPPPPPPAPAPKGTIVVDVITTGARPDANGYRVLLDHVFFGTVPALSEVILPLTPGPHTLELTELADNCVGSNSLSRTVQVTDGGRIAVTFLIDCPGQTSLKVVTVTNGPDPDPDGYFLTISNGVTEALATNGEFQLTTLLVGAYTLRLSSVSGNCAVTDGSARNISLQDLVPATVTFAVNCIARIDDTPGEKLVVSAHENGSPDTDLYLMDPSSGAMQRVTETEGYDVAPDFSRDGQRILFTRYDAGLQPRLVVLERATGKETLLPTLGFDRGAWSPDGTRIAFTRSGWVYTMAADGSRETRLSSGALSSGAYWSPDGTRIAFTRADAVMIINADGTALRQVGSADHHRVAGPWSPDGHTLVALRYDEDCSGYYSWYYGCSLINNDLWLLDVATGTETRLTNTPDLAERSPAWSVSGDRVYFVRQQDGNAEIFSQLLTGGDPINLTRSTTTEDWISAAYVGAPGSALKRRRP